ncbi:hypothetical protein [Nonomuraea sp. NPDC002799]
MSIASILTAVRDAIVSIAVIIGGGWTLYTFGLHRAHESYIKLDLDLVDRENTSQQTNIIIKIKAVNTGKTGIGQRLAWIEMFPLTYQMESVDVIQSPRPTKDDRACRFIVFEKCSYLEPGEEFCETLMIQIPPNISYVLAHAFFSGIKPGQTWQTKNVMRVDDTLH